MKCGTIRVKGDEWNSEELKRSGYGGLPICRLFLELLEESVWSNDYSVSLALMAESSVIGIGHRSFLPNGRLEIDAHSSSVRTIADVESALRAHLKASVKTLQTSISILSGQVQNLQQLASDIALAKAKAALVAAFPGATTATHFGMLGSISEFIAFSNRDNDELYAVRMSGDEPYGVAKLEGISTTFWYAMPDGLGPHGRHEYFFIALARKFAEDANVASPRLFNPELAKMTGTDDWDAIDHVVFQRGDAEVVVEFGQHALPRVVTVVEKAHAAAR